MHPCQRLALLSILSLATTLPLLAQGRLVGRVYDGESGEGLSGASVRLLSQSSDRQFGAVAGRDGRFDLRNVPAGTYRLSITYVSYRPYEQSGLVVGEGVDSVAVAMERQTIGRGEVVVTASRRPEKVTDAPASVTVVGARQVEERPVISVAEHLRGVPGLDLVQSGVSQNMIVARGFNNAFSGSMAVLTDNRIASVPSLRFNAYNFIPLVNEDIQQIEVVRGPGSALYGPNTANGVMHILTRSPFATRGTWLSLAAGTQEVAQAMIRHAGLVGERFGYKLSAQYMRGRDWGGSDSVEVADRAAFLADTAANGRVDPDTLRIGLRDNAVERLAGELRFDYAPIDDLTLIGAVGYNMAFRNPEITGVGGAQARDWSYTYYQLRALYGDLFLQAYFNRSDAGETYLRRTGASIVDRSSLFVAQAQHAWRPLESLRFTYGADLLLTTPVTDSTITGANEKNDDITEVGGYLQGELAVVPEILQVVAAGRLDHHSELADPIFSPRAAIVWHPLEETTVRLTYNQAYSAPTTNDMFLDVVVGRTPVFDVRASGLGSRGYSFRFDATGRPMIRSRFTPDPSAYMPFDSARSAAVWNGVMALVNDALRDLGATDTLRGIAPPPSSIPLVIRALNQSTSAFDSSGYPAAISGIRPTITSTIELGLQGVLFDRAIVAVDLYRSHYKDFIATLGVITPNVFLERSALQEHLVSEIIRTGFADTALAIFYGDLLAAQIGGIAGDPTTTGVPLGTISPVEASDPTALLFTSRNFGSLTVHGIDASLQVGLGAGVTASGTFSWVDRNYFEMVDGVADVSLNAPKLKYTIGGAWSDPGSGAHASLRMRHVGGFRVNSGVFFGDVPGYTTTDLTLGARVPGIEGLALSLAVTNLATWVEGREDSPFFARHIEFIGTPAIGTMALLRATYELD